MRRLLAAALIGVALLAVTIVGIATVLDARGLLTEGVENRLATHFDGLSRTLFLGVERLEDEVALVARSGSAAAALTAFRDAVDALESDPPAVSDDDLARLTDNAAALRAEAAEINDEVPPVGQLVPDGDVARYLQARYVVGDGTEGAVEGDGSGDDAEAAQAAADAYADVHVEFDPGIRRLRDELGFGDLLLLDADGRIVYSADKRADFGTDLQTGPFRDSALADAVTRRLAEVTVGETVLIDFSPYLPAGGAPVMFAVAAVSDGAEVVGAVAAEVPIEALNTITTAGGDWEEVGLGATGETYLVGPDGLMRSDARPWLEEPARFLDALPEQEATAVEAAGTTVLQEPVHTVAVEAAFDGDRFVGGSRNYLGQRRLAVAGPVGLAGLDWVLVADQALDEAQAPLREFAQRLLLLGLVLIPLVALAGIALARAITSRVRPVVRTAGALADGDLDAPVDTDRNDELEDVGRQLSLLASELKAQQFARAEEERASDEMLASVLPRRLLGDRQGADADLDALMDTGTVVALEVHGPLESAELDQQSAVELSSRLSGTIERLAEETGLERVRSSSDQHLYVAGLGEPDAAHERAAAFVSDVPEVLAEFEEATGVRVDYSAGLSAGDVAAVLFDGDEVTYGVFGAPIRTATMLLAVAGDGRVLVDPSIAATLGEDWTTVAAGDLVDLRGDSIQAAVLTGRAPEPEAARGAEPSTP